jgi:hypothetical protein
MIYHHAGGENNRVVIYFQVTDGMVQLSDIMVSIQVQAVNDAPQIVSNHLLGLSEGSSRTIGQTFLQLSDADNTYTELVYYITQLPAYGALILGGTSLDIADTFTQEDINNGLLSYQHNGAETVSDQFTFTISDGIASLPETVFQISISANNDTPILVLNTGLSLEEGTQQSIGSDILMVTDSDNTASELTYILSQMPEHGSLMNNHVLITDNRFTQQDILDQRITYTHDGSENVSDGFTFEVHDTLGASLNSTNFSIIIQPINDPPQLTINLPLSLNEGDSKAIPETRLLASDAETTNLTYTITHLPDYGMLVKSGLPLSVNDRFLQSDIGNGSIRYDHNGSEETTDHFSFIIGDADGAMISESTFSIQLISINDAPRLNDFTFFIDELSPNQTLVGQITADDPDVPQQKITYSINEGNTNNAFTIDPDTGNIYIQFTSAIDYETIPGHRFELTVQAQDNGTNPANRIGNGIVTININDINDRPELSPLNDIIMQEDQTAFTFECQINDAETLPDNMILSWHSTNQTLIADNQIEWAGSGHVRYVSISLMPDQSGLSSIAVTLTDAGGLSDSEYFTVTVQPVDDPPVINQMLSDQSMLEDAAMKTIPLIHAFTDIDNNDDDIIAQIGQNSNTAIVQAEIANHQLMLIPKINQHGTSTICITALSNGKRITQQLNVTIIPVDDPPYVAQAVATIHLDEDDAPATVNLESTFNDVDNDPNTIEINILNHSNPGLLISSLNNKVLTISPKSNQNGRTLLTLQARSDTQYVTSVITVDISPVDDPPEINNSLIDINAAEDDPGRTIQLNGLFTDIDNDDSTIDISIHHNSNTALIHTDISASTLNITFMPDQNGQANLILQALSNGKTVTNSVNILVSPIDDKPEIATSFQDITISEDHSDIHMDLSSHFTDRDNDDAAISLSILSNSNPSLISASISEFDLYLMLTENRIGTTEIVVRALSNGKSVDDNLTIHVIPLDDPPEIANEPENITLNEDASQQTIDMTYWFTDIDNEDSQIIKTIMQNTRPDIVNFQIAGNLLKLNIIANANGQSTLTIAANSNGLSISTQFTVNVLAVNDTPTVSNGIISVREDHQVSGQLMGQDIDQDTLTFIIQTSPQKGAITLTESTGQFIYSPRLNVNGADFFTFKAFDGKINSNTATISIQISPVNDPPVITDLERQGNENIAYYYTSADFLEKFSDIDRDSLSRIKITGLPSNGNLRLNENPIAQDIEISATDLSNLNFMPDLDFSGTTSYTWLAFDGTDWSEMSASVIMEIRANPVGIGTVYKTGYEDQILDFDASDLRNFTLNSTSYIQPITLPPHGQTLFDTQKTTEDHPFDGQPFEAGRIIYIYELFGGELQFIPDPNFNGFTSFMWRASKNDIWSEPDYVKITILPVNDIPIVQNIQQYVMEDSSVVFSLLDFAEGFSDVDGDSISHIRITGMITTGMGTIFANQLPITWNQEIPVQDIPSLQYTTLPNNTDTQGFYWQASDGTVWSENTAAAYIHITPVADTPQSLTVSTYEDSCTSIILKKHIDDVDVSWFKISSIQKGQLFNYDQSLEILSESYISYSQSQEGLMFCPAPDSVETGFFDVESSENGIHVSPQSDRARINITVIPVDDAPFVTSPLGTKTANEDDLPTLIDLKTVFHDIDNAPDEIRYSIHENTNRTLVKVSITETTLQLSYQPDQSGDARITILALSNGKTEMDNLNIQVLSIDDPPIIKHALADIQTIEDSYGKSIDLTHVFTDIDNDDALIVKSIHSNSNTDLVQASIQRNTLFLSFLPEQHGTATVMIKGQSNGKEVLASITILVESQDDPPYIAQQLEDIQTHEDAGDITIPLISVFSDKDNDDSTIRLSLYFQSHPDICTASIENNHLMVSLIPEQNGVCQMIIQAESQGLTAHMNMNVNVTAIDDPPVVKNPISMITVQEDDPDYVIDLSQVFTDIDNDDAAMVISVFNNTNSDLVEASVKSEQNTVLSLSESSEPRALASDIASEPCALASGIASKPHALASDIASEPRALASGIASEPRALASGIASEPRALASDIASEPRALASDIASEPRALASDIASEPRALASGIASEPCALASDIASEPRALASDIFLSDVCSMPLADAHGSDSFVRGSGVMPLADPRGSDLFVRGSDAIPLADAHGSDSFVRGSDAMPLADARGSDSFVRGSGVMPLADARGSYSFVRGSDAISLADARGSDAISLANARGSDSKLLNLHFLPNQNGIATITLKAQSGAQYVTHSFAITVIPVDDTPIIHQSIEDIIVDEDAPTTQIDLIPIFSDIDNDDNAIIKQISDNSNTALITPKIIENQLFIAYKANQSGDATLILSAQSNGKTITTSAKIHVNAINDAPIAKNSSLVIKEDQTITGKLSAQDIENDQIYYMLSKAATGYVDINNFITGEFTYTPQKNYYGDDSFMFFATDGELKSYSATVSITIQPINDAPETGSFALDSYENTELFFSFANFNSVFTDIDGDQLKKIRITQLPQKGTLLLNNSEIASNSSVFAEHLSQFSFIPDLDWAGTTSFTYKASDDLAWSAEAGQVTITVIAYPPGTAMVIKSGTEDQQVTFSATDLKDFRLNSTSWLKLTALPEHGILLFDPVMPDDTHTFEGVLLNEGDEVKYLDFIAGQLVYIPEPNFYGLDVYKWKASKNDIWSDDALVKLNIMPVNDPPTIHSIEINAVEDAIIEFNRSDFISSYTDIENDTLSKLQFISLPDSAMGQLRLNDQDVTMGQDLDALLLDQLTFYPMANISGTAICLFKVSDAKNWSLPSNLTMHLAPVGDTPVVKGLDIIEDSPSEPIIIQKHPQDGDEVTAFLIDHINGGQLNLVSNNTPIANQSFISTAQGLSGLTFIPTENNTNECGFDVWSSEDGQTIAAQSDAAHVTITIMPVDDPPFIGNGLPDLSLKEDNPIVTRDLNQVFFDVDNDQSSMQFIVASLSNPALLTATIVNHTLNIKLYANQLGASDIVIAAISNGKTVQTGCHITVSSLQDAPVTENMTIQTFENMPISNTVIAYDADHDKLSYHLVEPVQKGLLSLNSETGEFTYTPTQYENGSDAFRFNVFDGVDDSNSSVVSIWITPVNNPPTISDFQKTGNEDTKLFFNTSYFSSVFSDPDHDQLECIRVIQLPENGQLLINDVPIEINERIIATTISQMNFMPAQNWYGTTSFIWVASDGALISENQATVTITITDIPDNIDMIVKSGLEDTDIIFTDEDLAPFNIEGLIYVKAVTLPQSGVLLYDQDAPSPDHEFTPIQLSEGQELHISVFMTGVMLYRPEPDFNGSVSFLWRANTSGVWTEDGMVKITIFPVNDPPMIADLSVSGKEDTVITFNKTDFVSVFSDIDGDLLNQIKITQLPASSLGTLYKNNTPLQVNTDIPKNDIASLTFKPNKDQFGQGKFLWKAFDGESWSKTSQKYDINILPIADTPMSQTYETLEDTATEPIYLTKHINDGDEVLYFKISNILNGQLFMADSDQEIVNASFISVKNSQKGLVFKPLSNVTSHCGFNVEASENGMTVSEQSNRAYIDIHIIPVDDPPEILSEIQNIHAQEDDSPILVDISNTFTDPDSLDDQISIQVINIDNPQLFEINQKDYRLTIQFKDNQHGQGQFTVMGISNGLTVSRQVSVQVAPVDDPPYVSNPIENLSLNEDVAPFDIDLSTVFNDIDSEDLKLFIADNSNPQLLSVVMSNEKLLIKAFNNQNGSTNITIIAEADNQQISETFSIDIAAVDDPPSVLNPPDALTVFEDDSTIPLDLSSTFTDIDNDDSNIKISVLTVSQQGLLSATIMDKQLQIHLTNDQFGQTTLILQAESNNQTITQAIDITVLSVDDPPEINSPVADIIVQEDASAITTNISAVFMDKDSDNAAIEILLLNNTNELLCDARVLGHTLVIQLIDNQYGASQITLMARSDGLFVTHEPGH